jgi:hypothetical protein
MLYSVLLLLQTEGVSTWLKIESLKQYQCGTIYVPCNKVLCNGSSNFGAISEINE